MPEFTYGSEKMVPQRICASAALLLGTQNEVPVSPCSTGVDGNLELCAEVALARVGLEEMHSDLIAEDFENSLAENASRQLVAQAFQALGWSAEFCKHVMLMNDNSLPNIRKRNMLQLLEDLSSA